MKLLLLSLLAFGPGLAQAQEIVSLGSLFSLVQADAPICYGREYSTEHLENNAQQTVKKLRVKMVKDLSMPTEPTEMLDVEIALKGEDNFFKVYRAYFICDSAAGECTVECDGGRVKVWGKMSGEMMFENLGFVIDGGCGDARKKPTMLTPSSSGDALFELAKLPAEYCQL